MNIKLKPNTLKYILLMVIVLTSLCTNIPNLPFLNGPSQVATSGIELSNEDIYLNFNALPSEITGGENVTVIFQLANKANYNLEDVYLDLYDPCVFNNGNEITKTKFCENCLEGELKSNRTYSWSWTLHSEPILLSRDCELKFRLNYKGKFSFYQDIAVLAQSEYNSRLIQGTLKDIPITSSCSAGPLQISPTFSEDQPFLDGTSHDVQINYAYTGSGFIDVGKDDITINVPTNLQVSDIACRGDYDPVSGGLSLNKTLKFINKKASPSTCTFTAKSTQPLDIKSLSITANYNYGMDSSIPIKVKGTSPSSLEPQKSETP